MSEYLHLPAPSMRQAVIPWHRRSAPTENVENTQRFSKPYRHPNATKKQQGIVLVATEDMYQQLAKYLQMQGYVVYATANHADAVNILDSVDTTMVLLHYPPDLHQVAWDIYTTLRERTSAPVMLSMDITAEHFVTTEDHTRAKQQAVDLANYLHAIRLLSQTWRF